MFDTAIAVAKIDPGFNCMWALRDRYPELAFMFDELETMREEREEVEEELQQAVHDAQRETETLELRAEEARDMIRRLDDDIENALDYDADDVPTAEQLLAELEATREELRGVLAWLE